MGWSFASGSTSGGSTGGGGWSLISSPTPSAPSTGGGGWSFSEPVTQNSYPSGSFTSYNAGYGLPYSPGVIGGAGLSFGPYGEGTYTPLDFPVTRPLRPGERLEDIKNGVVSKSILPYLALGALAIFLLKDK